MRTVFRVRRNPPTVCIPFITRPAPPDEWSRIVDAALAAPGAEGVASVRLQADGPMEAAAWSELIARSAMVRNRLFWTTHPGILKAIDRGEGLTMAVAFQGHALWGTGTPEDVSTELATLFEVSKQSIAVRCLAGGGTMCKQCLTIVDMVLRDRGLTPERVHGRRLPHNALQRTRDALGLVLWCAPGAPGHPALLLAAAGRSFEVAGGCNLAALNELVQIADGLGCFHCNKLVPGAAFCSCGSSNVCRECLDKLATKLARMHNLQMQAQPLAVPLLCDACTGLAKLPVRRADLKRCGWCASPGPKLKRCAACALVAYCSKNCQEMGWRTVHSEVCKLVRQPVSE